MIRLPVDAVLPDGRDVHHQRSARSKSPTGDPAYLAPRGTPDCELRHEGQLLSTELVLDKHSSGAFNFAGGRSLGI